MKQTFVERYSVARAERRIGVPNRRKSLRGTHHRDAIGRRWVKEYGFQGFGRRATDPKE